MNPLDLLPNFQTFVYSIAVPPPQTKIEAWSKLREAERRLAMYRWVKQHNDPGTAQHRVLLTDSVSAFLLTFESGVQFLMDQFDRSPTAPPFWDWFRGQPQNDICVKGLRTLRHFEAHVEPIPSARIVSVELRAFIGRENSDRPNISCEWRLPELTPAQLKKLKRPPLPEADLGSWNNMTKSADAEAVFTDGLLNLKNILEASESAI